MCAFFWSLNDDDWNSWLRREGKNHQLVFRFRLRWSSFIKIPTSYFSSFFGLWSDQKFSFRGKKNYVRTKRRRRHILMTTVVEIILKGVRHYNRTFLPKRKMFLNTFVCLIYVVGYWQQNLPPHFTYNWKRATSRLWLLNFRENDSMGIMASRSSPKTKFPKNQHQGEEETAAVFFSRSPSSLGRSSCKAVIRMTLWFYNGVFSVELDVVNW